VIAFENHAMSRPKAVEREQFQILRQENAMALHDEYGSAPQVGCSEVPLDSLGSFKFWRIQNPNSAKLLKEIIFRWRGASAYVRGKPGKWVVWPRERWREWTGLSRNQLDRALKELVESNLINRERHKFAGSEVRTYLRPTQTALKYLGRPQDLAKAAPAVANESIVEKLTEKSSEKSGEKIAEKITEKTDYTSVPSVSINPTVPSSSTETTGPFITENQEGNGKVGEDEIDDQIIAKCLAKKKEDDQKQFPEVQGPHQKYVRHPSAIFPKWVSFSKLLKTKLYDKYLQYVDNWNNGKKAKSMLYSDWTDEDDQAFLDAAAAKKKSQNASAASKATGVS
jgi:DNA-binding MarR family transcriptional regulator